MSYRKRITIVNRFWHYKWGCYSQSYKHYSKSFYVSFLQTSTFDCLKVVAQKLMTRSYKCFVNICLMKKNMVILLLSCSVNKCSQKWRTVCPSCACQGKVLGWTVLLWWLMHLAGFGYTNLYILKWKSSEFKTLMNSEMVLLIFFSAQMARNLL